MSESFVDPEVEDTFRKSGHHIHLRVSCLEFSKKHLLSTLDNDCAESHLIRWKEAPPLDRDSGRLCCTSLGGTIYALGGSLPKSCTVKECIGKEFTPEIGEWKPLPQPPSHLQLERNCISCPLIPDKENNRLLVHFSSAGALYAYDPAQKTWDCLNSIFPYWSSASTLVDGVLYAHSRGSLNCIVAYDVSNSSWLKVEYSSPFPRKVGKCEYKNMLYLGNDILCLTLDLPIFKEMNVVHSCLEFVKFSVKRTSLTEVLVTPITIHCIPLDQRVIAIRFFTL